MAHPEGLTLSEGVRTEKRMIYAIEPFRNTGYTERKLFYKSPSIEQGTFVSCLRQQRDWYCLTV